MLFGYVSAHNQKWRLEKKTPFKSGVDLLCCLLLVGPETSE